MTRSSVIFQSPREVVLEESARPQPSTEEVLIASELSAISAGTEMLVYRGQAPTVECPSEVPEFRGPMTLPMKFGYSMVGKVSDVGSRVDPAWLGRRVFAFHPHESHFVAPVQGLIALPEDLIPERGVFLPNMETAVNLVHDARPLTGERVLVLGQGVVGLLTVALLSRFPLAELVSLDPIESRRRASLQMGVDVSLSPDEFNPAGDFDLCFEVSGNPATLNVAIQATRFSGRVVIGSWYGTKSAEIQLGTRFHRSRIQLLSSQVSSLNPGLSGAWTKNRRLEWAQRMLERIAPERLITHRFPFSQAARAFSLIDQAPCEATQVVLTYS